MPRVSFEDQLRRKVYLEELNNRQANQSQLIDLANDFLLTSTANVPWQYNFIQDQTSHKALFGERRGGKTTLMGIAAIYQALLHPYSQILYIGLTQDSCQRTMYDQVLSRLLRSYSLPAKLLNNDQMKFDNGSIIYLIGLDANKKQKEKVRGVKSSLNMIDEMQSYQQDTSLIINEILGPSAADTKAPTILGGTAGNALGKNYWYEITQHNSKDNPISKSVLHPEWTVYRCQWKDNTAIDEMTKERVCDNVSQYLTNLIHQHPGIDQTPSYRQEWNAEWIIETSSLIYRYSPANLLSDPSCTEIDTKQPIPSPSPQFLHSATYILGIDLGYNDPTALSIVAYNLQYSNKLYLIETFKQSEMLIPQVAEKIKTLDQHYHFTYMVGDSSSLQVFETLKHTYSLPIEKANRQGKLSHQLVLNSDLLTRSVVLMPGNDELIQQLQSCIWDRKALQDGEYIEDQKYKNDLADSFLYAHHFSRHLWYHAPKPKLTPEQHFYSSIIQGEQKVNRQTLIQQGRKKLNPYSNKLI